MSEGKKAKNSPNRRRGNSFEDTDGKEMFPELPPFFADINQILKDDPLIKAYEREYWYESERHFACHANPTIPDDGDEGESRQESNAALTSSCDDVVEPCQEEDAASKLAAPIYTDPFASKYMTSAYFSKSWEEFQHKSCETFESILKSDRAAAVREAAEKKAAAETASRPSTPVTTTTAGLGEREKTHRVVKEFHQIFPVGDIGVREAEQLSVIELFCEGIAKEIVNKSAEMFTSRCFEAIKEGYTAHSVWEELKDSVAHAFLPLDFAQLPLSVGDLTQKSTYFGYVGDSIDKARSKKQLPFSHHFLGEDVPSSLLLSASARLKLSASQTLAELHPRGAERYAGGRNAVSRHKPIESSAACGPGEEPANVSIDEYCRYVVPVTEPASTLPSRPSAVFPPGPGAELSKVIPSDRIGSAASSTHPTIRAEKTDKDTIPIFRRNSRAHVAKQKREKPLPAHRSPSLSVSSEKHDDLTTALKKVPHSYFNQRFAAPDTAAELESANATARQPLVLDALQLDATAPQLMTPSMPKLTGRRSARGERAIPLINIEGDAVLLARDVEKEISRAGSITSRRKPLRNMEAAGEYKPVAFSVALPESPRDEDQGHEHDPIPPKHNTSVRRLLPDESKKVAERKRLKEMQETRERERMFVVPLQQSDEVQNHIEVKPEPGVQVRRPPSNSIQARPTRPGQKGRKDEPQIVSDGGEYIIPENKQRWTDSAKSVPREKKPEAPKLGTMIQAPAKTNPIPNVPQTKDNAVLDKLQAKEILKNREISRSAPKIMKSQKTEALSKAGRVVVANSANRAQDRLPQLPVAPSARRSEALLLHAKQTKRSSFSEQDRLKILSSALTAY